MTSDEHRYHPFNVDTYKKVGGKNRLEL